MRLIACLLVAGLDLTRLAHASHPDFSNRTDGAAAQFAREGSHHNPADAPPTHDSDDCQICQFIATGSAAVLAARPAIISASLHIDRQLPPIIAEPHSADIDLPCAARAPPIAIHATT